MFYTQDQEDADYELNAQYDYIRETYGATAEGLADSEDEHVPHFARV